MGGRFPRESRQRTTVVHVDGDAIDAKEGTSSFPDEMKRRIRANEVVYVAIARGDAI